MLRISRRYHIAANVHRSKGVLEGCSLFDRIVFSFLELFKVPKLRSLRYLGSGGNLFQFADQEPWMAWINRGCKRTRWTLIKIEAWWVGSKEGISQALTEVPSG